MTEELNTTTTEKSEDIKNVTDKSGGCLGKPRHEQKAIVKNNTNNSTDNTTSNIETTQNNSTDNTTNNIATTQHNTKATQTTSTRKAGEEPNV